MRAVILIEPLGVALFVISRDQVHGKITAVADIQSTLRERFADAMGDVFGDEHRRVDPLIRLSANPRFGDFQANVAMSLAKQVRQKPRDVAQAIVDRLQLNDVCQRVEIAGPGFINLHVRSDFLAAQLNGLAGETANAMQVERSQRVVVDYGGPNMAKEMHIGNMRSTCIGDCIVRVLERVGHQVIRQNQLGDWGTLFGMLLEHLSQTTSTDHSIADLDALYRQAKQRFENEPGFADRARQQVVALQSGDPEAQTIWRRLINESIQHMDGVLRRLGVMLTNDDICPESYYNPKLAGLVDELAAAGLLEESRGAKVVFPRGFKDREGAPQALIVQKTDGGFLYATFDLTAVHHRITQLKADRIIYVVDSRQSQHFQMVFEIARQAGWADESVRLDYVPFGTIQGKNGKPFKTREGDAVKLANVLDEAEQRAAAIINEKHPDLPAPQRAQIARTVGIGALKYADLCSDRIKDYIFDWDRMLALDGNTAPYIQNAYVRIGSIFRKGQIDPASIRAEPVVIADPVEHAVAIQVLQLPAVVAAVAESLEPHRLCTYLYELATLFHRFYERCPVLTAPDEPTRASRLALSDLVARTLQQGLDLLGIGVVEQM